MDEVLEAILSEAWELPETPIEDALFGRSDEIWALRHALSEGVKSAGPLIVFDLGFTRDKVIAFRSEITGKLAADFPMMEICDFGHLDDGGLHFNLVKTDGPVDTPFEQALRDYVVEQMNSLMRANSAWPGTPPAKPHRMRSRSCAQGSRC